MYCNNSGVSFRKRNNLVMINGLSFFAITIACLAWSFAMTDYKENKGGDFEKFQREEKNKADHGSDGASDKA